MPYFPAVAKTTARPLGPAARPKGFPIARIFGIQISADWSWLVIWVIVVFSLFGSFARSYANASPSLVWAAAFLTAALFFSSIILHELSHSLVARARGLEVHGITLFVFGGVSELRTEPKKASDELLMATVGPVTSALLALLFWGLRAAFPSESVGRGVLGWLGSINLALAVFNLLPGFPLDGGRILRAIVWKVTGSFKKASQVATGMGRVLAYGLIVLGVVLMFGRGDWTGGVWIAFIGWFLLSAAQSSMAQVRVRESLGKRIVSQLMRSECTKVPSSETVRSFVEDRLLKTGERCFAVSQGERMVGLVTLQDVKRIPREEWGFTPVQSIMVPIDKVHGCSPADSLADVMEKMNSTGVNQLPVLGEDGALLGILTREDLLRAIAVDLEIGPEQSRW